MSSPRHSERGAILIHVAVASLALIAFTMFVVDYGILWVSRHQAQNSADAGALAAGAALAFDDDDNFDTDGPARQAGYNFAVENNVWGQDPNIDIDGDIQFSQESFDSAVFPDECQDANCVRVDVFRNQTRGNPLPMWFGQLVGLTTQGVRAMAIARAGYGSFSDRVRPWAIPDRWDERCGSEESFDPIDAPCGPPADTYQSCATASPCTGYSAETDLGRAVLLKNGSPHDAISPSHFNPIVLENTGPGGAEYRDNIVEGGDATIGNTIPIEPGNMIGPTQQGTGDLYDLDPTAVWCPNCGPNNRGCVVRPAGSTTCVESPRIVCIPVFDPALYWDSRMHGRLEVFVTNLLGMFVEPLGANPPGYADFINADPSDVENNDVWGWLTHCPGSEGAPDTEPGPFSFIRFVQLVR